MLSGSNRGLQRCLLLSCALVILLFCFEIVDGHQVAHSHNESTAYNCFDDASWAVKTQRVSDRLTPSRRVAYDKFLESCRTAAGEENAWRLCDKEEQHRLHMNVDQPPSVYNYTDTGFRKGRAPESLRHLLQAFWNKNHPNNAAVEWKEVNPYHNPWDTEPDIVNVADRRLLLGGPALQAAIADAVRPLLEEWTGMRQAMTSVYGIRIYYRNSILTPHVDRLPLVASAIINVAQKVDTPWALEVYDHNGQAHNVTMEPWDILLYESHSVIHGRPFPLDGQFYANVFVHFEPIGPLVLDDNTSATTELEEESALPPYLVPSSSWEEEWRRENPDGWQLLKNANLLAQKGDLTTLEYLAWRAPASLRVPDDNGWQPIHEAARFGHLDILKFLVEEQGIDVNERTRMPGASSPLVIARRYLRKAHPVIDYLQKQGGVEEQDDDISNAAAMLVQSEL